MTKLLKNNIMNNSIHDNNVLKEYTTTHKKHHGATRYLGRLKNNQCMYLSQLLGYFLDDWDTLSKDSQYYLNIPQILFGTRDFHARIGKFENPFASSVSPAYAPPPLVFSSTKMIDVADRRAMEIIKNAKDTGRNIGIMWSGGIDSTVVLVAILKNISEADHELLTVYLSTQSILDNPDFYFKFLSSNKKIKIESSTSLRIDNSFLDKNIILTGDPGDGVFGPSTAMYTNFIETKTHLESWKNHYKMLAQTFEPTIEKHMTLAPGIGEWFMKIMSQSLAESGLSDHVSSVADFYWWTYFNFKWAALCTYPLHNSILGRHHEGITRDNDKFFAENIFYHSTEWQIWTYSNLKKLIGLDVFKTHKLEAREYICEFDKNTEYFARKRKTSTPPPNMKLSKSSLIGHDKDWKPIYIDTKADRQLVSMLLRKYRQ